MSKSKAKISRKWNSLIRINGGDRFTRLYTLSGVEDQNDKGQDFYNVTIKNKGFVTEEIFTYAERVYELVQSGVATADRSVEISDEDYADETEM